MQKSNHFTYIVAFFSITCKHVNYNNICQVDVIVGVNSERKVNYLLHVHPIKHICKRLKPKLSLIVIFLIYINGPNKYKHPELSIIRTEISCTINKKHVDVGIDIHIYSVLILTNTHHIAT